MADARGRLLLSVVELLEAKGIPYCILHGYREYPSRVPSDVDCIMPPKVLPRGLAALLAASRDRLGAAVVQWIQHESTAHYFVLATDGSGPQWQFLSVDVSSDYRRNGRVFYRGEEILASRRLDRGFSVPSPAIEFACYLVKKIAKGSLLQDHAQQLTLLHRHDPAGCDREVARFWRGDRVGLIAGAARSGEWSAVQELLPSLRGDLLRPATVRALWSSGRYWAADALRRLRRWREPTGIHVVLLGADGSGKSTIVSGLAAGLAPAFRHVASTHLAPALFRSARASHTVTAPHSRRPRSSVGSLAKAAYWLLDYSLGYYARIRPALARSTLVLFDRYLLDALVDPTRYRYRGPRWVLRLLWSLIPKPDLVILLDAPTELVRTRKQEVSRAETERQRWAYRKLVEALPTGHIVDAAQPVDRVATAAGTLVLDCLASRTSRYLAGPSRAGRP